MAIKSNKYVLDESLAHLTARFYRSVMKQINHEFAKEGLEITLDQWPILIHVWNQNGISQNDLAKRLFKDKTTIARSVAGIELSGMIAKLPSLEDGRGKNIYLTDKGKSIMSRATAIVQRIDDASAEAIDERELQVCKKVLHCIHGSLAQRLFLTL